MTMLNSIIIVAFAVFSGGLVGAWEFAGPGGGLNVQPLPMTVSGATNAVLKVPGGWLVASVNGGVWRTTDAINITTAEQQPNWVPVFDSSPVTCTSMTSLSMSINNPNTIYAGCGGSTSSQQGYAWNVLNNGDWRGFAVSMDAGVTWKMAEFPPNYSVQSIVDLPTGEVLVATRGHYSNASDLGGIWRSTGNVFDATSWTRTYANPTFTLVLDPISSYVYASTATLSAANAVLRSKDGGKSWMALTSGLSFTASMIPFYSCLTLTPNASLFLGVMTTPPAYLNTGLGGGFGQLFYLNLSMPANAIGDQPWAAIGAQPMVANPSSPNQDCSYTCSSPADCCLTVDNDFAARDRMAIFVQPDDDSILYMAGNGGYLIYRIDWRRSLNQPPCTVNQTSGTCYNASVDPTIWQGMFNTPFQNDTIDAQFPHVDFRNFAWDSDTASLLVVSDGGVYVRFLPNTSSGWWRGYNGNLGTFEYISISYDVKLDRWAAGAQDNNVHISQPNCVAHAKENSICWTGGDGTMTTVDNSVTPARLFGADQFASGLSFVQSNETTVNATDNATPVHIASRGFPARNSPNPMTQQSVMPFFQSPFSVNFGNPSSICFWANVSINHANGLMDGPGIFCEDVMPVNGSNASLAMPTYGYNIIDFVAGGTINGSLRDDVFAAVSPAYLFTSFGNATEIRPFPVPFTDPCSPSYTTQYCNFAGAPVSCTAACQTWPNHATTMSLAVADWDALTMAVSGWPNLTSNTGDENIFLTRDGGKTFVNIAGDLVAATGAIGKARPMGLTFVSPNFLVAGTTRGVFATRFDRKNPNPLDTATSVSSWTRIGSTAAFPLVKVSALAYYPSVDVMMGATMGRGVWKLSHASAAISSALSLSATASSSALSAGAVVGIIAGAAVVAGIVFAYLKAQAKKRQTHNDNLVLLS